MRRQMDRQHHMIMDISRTEMYVTPYCCRDTSSNSALEHYCLSLAGITSQLDVCVCRHMNMRRHRNLKKSISYFSFILQFVPQATSRLGCGLANVQSYIVDRGLLAAVLFLCMAYRKNPEACCLNSCNFLSSTLRGWPQKCDS